MTDFALLLKNVLACVLVPPFPYIAPVSKKDQADVFAVLTQGPCATEVVIPAHWAANHRHSVTRLRSQIPSKPALDSDADFTANRTDSSTKRDESSAEVSVRQSQSVQQHRLVENLVSCISSASKEQKTKLREALLDGGDIPSEKLVSAGGQSVLQQQQQQQQDNAETSVAASSNSREGPVAKTMIAAMENPSSGNMCPCFRVWLSSIDAAHLPPVLAVVEDPCAKEYGWVVRKNLLPLSLHPLSYPHIVARLCEAFSSSFLPFSSECSSTQPHTQQQKQQQQQQQHPRRVEEPLCEFEQEIMKDLEESFMQSTWTAPSVANAYGKLVMKRVEEIRKSDLLALSISMDPTVLNGAGMLKPSRALQIRDAWEWVNHKAQLDQAFRPLRNAMLEAERRPEETDAASTHQSTHQKNLTVQTASRQNTNHY
eukprot:ANDGO_05618.mRNA.1 hypothetical protein